MESISIEAAVGLAALFVTFLFGIISMIATLIGCTWYLANKLNKFVTHEVCHTRRESCPCWSELEHIKQMSGIPSLSPPPLPTSGPVKHKV